MSSRVSGFLDTSPCLWGKLQNLSFSKVSKQVVMSFCVAGVALCDIPTCLITRRKCQNQDVSQEMLLLLRPRVSSRISGFLNTSPCLWGKLQNLSFSKVSKQVVMSFCVAGVALCDIPTCLITRRKCQNCRTSCRKCFFAAPTCLVSGLWFSGHVAVPMGEAAKPLLFEGFQAGCHVVLRGRRGPL